MSHALLQTEIRKLWEDPSTHTFMTKTSYLLQTFSLEKIVLESASYVASRCYEENYQKTVPHCLMGLEAAWQLGEFFYSGNRILPIVQMLWYAVGEAQSPPIDIKKLIGPPPKEDQLNIETFKKVYEAGLFEEAFRIAIFLLRMPQERKKLFGVLFHYMMADEANIGHKMIYLVKSWEFSELTQWKNYQYLWFPMFHYLMKGAPYVETLPVVEVFYHQHERGLLKSISHKQNMLSQELYAKIKSSMYDDEKETTLEKMATWMSEGESLETLFEGVCLAANELVYLSEHKKWVTSIHAFHYAQCVSGIVLHVEPADRIKVLLLSALFVKRMAILSKPLIKPLSRPLETLAQKNNPLFYVELGIQKGDVGMALGAFDYLMGQGGVGQDVYETLAFLASKNLYSVLYAHDIKFAYACLKSYKTANHSLKSMYLKSLVKLLSEEPKEWTLYYGLANTQKIKLGYYSSPGEFNF